MSQLAARIVSRGILVALIATLAANFALMLVAGDRVASDSRPRARHHPPLLADKGLATALEMQARRSPVPISVDADGLGAKYAGASRATVAFAHDDGRLSFRVSDDGVGFDPARATAGLGLQGMADRVEAIGGSFVIRSAPGEGTTITGTIPVR